jgi:hypothetical protein
VLISKLRAKLSAETFEEFRAAARRYQRGDVTSRDYFGVFNSLVGTDMEADGLFMEHIRLLPLEEKRKELLACRRGGDGRRLEWERRVQKTEGEARLSTAQFPALPNSSAATVSTVWERKEMNSVRFDDSAFPSLPSNSSNSVAGTTRWVSQGAAQLWEGEEEVSEDVDSEPVK